uniref:Uncharacterized protein n=1 Tax=Arundo donax TaxID=35708 RepID=A0A0A9GH15_ARUDO
MYNQTLSSRGKWKENSLSLHLYYSGRGHLQLVNAAGLFTRLGFKKLLSKLLHMHLDFEKLYALFCSLVRWRTEKWNMGGSVSSRYRVYLKELRKIMTLDLRDSMTL